MDENISGLQTKLFSEYVENINELRKRLESGEEIKFSDEEFMFVMRPYYWFLHNPGFQDLVDLCDVVANLLMNHEEAILQSNVLSKSDLNGLIKFLVMYSAKGMYDTSNWMIFASPEIAVFTDLERIIEVLKKSDTNDKELEKMQELSDVMKQIEGAKHTSYYCLRIIGASNVKNILKIFDKLSLEHKGYVLHALDGAKGNEEVIKLYEDFISTTTSKNLKAETEKYLERVKG